MIVVVCAAFGLTVSESKTEIMCFRTEGVPESTATFSAEAAGQVYNQTNEFVYLGGNVSHNTLRRARHSVLTRCIGRRKNDRADHPISMKTGRESMEAVMRRGRILLPGFVGRMEDTRLPKCVMFVMFGGLVGGGGGEKEKKVDGVSPGRPQSFRYQRRPVDDCGPGRGAEQGAERFMIAKWIAAEKARAGLWHAVVCPNVMMNDDGKGQGRG